MLTEKALPKAGEDLPLPTPPPEDADLETRRAYAAAVLEAELEKGERSAREHGWFTAEEARKMLGLL